MDERQPGCSQEPDHDNQDSIHLTPAAASCGGPLNELAGVAGEGSRGAPPARLFHEDGLDLWPLDYDPVVSLKKGMRSAFDAADAWLRPMTGGMARMLRTELHQNLRVSFHAVGDCLARIRAYAQYRWASMAGAREVVRAIEEGFQYDDEAEARKERFVCEECGIKYDRHPKCRHLCRNCAADMLAGVDR